MRWICGISAKVVVGRNRREFITMLGGAVGGKDAPGASNRSWDASIA
jgi:hypothetical protein